MIRHTFLSALVFFLFAYYYLPLQGNSNSINTQKIQPGRTFILAAIFKDGIIVGSDTRYAFLDDQNKVLAYFDKAQKIYQHQNILVAVSGNYSFDSLQISALFRNFSSSHTDKSGIGQFFSSFTKYAKTVLSIKEYTELLENQFLICGYLNKKPIIQYYDGKGKYSSFLHSGYITNHKEDNNTGWVNKYIKNADKDEAIQFIIKVIERVIENKNEDTVSAIGGKVSIAYIDSNDVNWVQKQEGYEYYNVDDFYNSILNGNTKMWYRSLKDSILLREAIINRQ